MPRKKPLTKVPHRHAIGSSVMDGNGHPTALTPLRHARLIEELKKGDWPALAAIRADCSPRTVERWVVMGCDPVAVEPYRSFAAAFVKVEAELAAEMMGIVLAHARGGKRPKRADGYRPNLEAAIWVLQNRFRFLWAIDKEGKQGGISVTEIVFDAMGKMDEARAVEARAFLKQLNEDQKRQAREKGFLV
jgi:hypothetical protein